MVLTALAGATTVTTAMLVGAAILAAASLYLPARRTRHGTGRRSRAGQDPGLSPATAGRW